MKRLFENWRIFLERMDLGYSPRGVSSKPQLTSEQLMEIKANSLSALSFFRKDGEREGIGTLNEEKSFEYEISLAQNPNENIVQGFHASMNKGERSGYLTYYTPEELKTMDLYKLAGQDAGFAIKDGNDIVSVHNNSELRGLANEFMNKAKKAGGTKLDHFDGFLSGLYRKHGFLDVYEIYQWGEQYAPEEWKFEKVNIMNPKTSVYADAMKALLQADERWADVDAWLSRGTTLSNEEANVTAESGFETEIKPKLKFDSYKWGRPDVIMRRL